MKSENPSVQFRMPSPVGALYLVASPTALQGLYWDRQSAPMLNSVSESGPGAKILARAIKQLEEYFAGRRKDFDLPLDVHGTAFQESVWTELKKIPYGQTLSYRDVARKIRNHKAVRAVGTANGRNPISIIVPCHRVIAANGSLGGYGGGLPVKTKLLELERSAAKK